MCGNIKLIFGCSKIESYGQEIVNKLNEQKAKEREEKRAKGT
jgi:hypothetical protein